MPLTAKGEEILAKMKQEYGAEHGERVFYASKNAGTITGVDGDAARLVHSVTVGVATVKCYYNPEYEEYTCKLYVRGSYQGAADYFTNDLQDAKDTAGEMAKRADANATHDCAVRDCAIHDSAAPATLPATVSIAEMNRRNQEFWK